MPSIILPANTRYKETSVYADSDGIQFFGTWKRLLVSDIQDYSIYVLSSEDIGRFDLLAYNYYGDSSLSWVIMDFNGIVDPFFGFYVGQKIKIPDWGEVVRILF